MIKQNFEQRRIDFTLDIAEAVAVCEVCFITVGTPMDKGGAADLSCVYAAARDIGRYMQSDICVVNKSAVPVGTSRIIEKLVREELDGRGAYFDFEVVSCPEFLREGAAVTDCMRPDRVVIGADKGDGEIVRELYMPFVRNVEGIVGMDRESAEMTKYAANAMLATKISFMNEIVNLCEKTGAERRSGCISLGRADEVFSKKRPLSVEFKEHFADLGGAELADELQMPLRAVNLCSLPALSTAFANDVEPDYVFAQLALAYTNPGDVFIGISTSGNARNVHHAAVAAKVMGARLIGLTGADGGKMRESGLYDVLILVPETTTHLIQEGHVAVYHAVCIAVEESFFTE